LPGASLYSDYRELLKREDISAVDLLVPISENFEIARDILNAKKNLIAEKPFASTIEGANELISIKNKNNLKVLVAENMRYDESVTVIKQILDSGQIGEIAYFILNTGADFEKDMIGDTFGAKEWRQHRDFKGGIFLDGGIHDIALMRHIFGDIKTIAAFGKKHDKDYCQYLSISSLLNFSSGVTGSYCYFSKGADLIKPPIGLRIFRTLGDIYLESKESGVINISLNDGTTKTVNFTPKRGYYNELLSFYTGNILSTPEEEINDIKAIFDIISKIENRR